ncbi:MAG: hypothetical protein K0R18_814 [Bacillales bacterium]|nr:hypothetical protein [Bacillales bacterium]
MIIMQFLKSLKRILKDESGSATIIEATLVFPVVFFVIGFLIITSFYQLQKSALQSDAQRIALAFSKSKVIPEYNRFGRVISNQIDFESIPQSYPLHLSTTNNNLYRYLSTEFENEVHLKSQFRELIQDNAILAGPMMVCEMNCLNGFPNQSVIVTIKCQINFPGFLSYFNLPKINLMQVCGIASIVDSAEFVRNIDMTFDAVTYLKDQTQFGKEFSSFIYKIGRVIPNGSKE